MKIMTWGEGKDNCDETLLTVERSDKDNSTGLSTQEKLPLLYREPEAGNFLEESEQRWALIFSQEEEGSLKAQQTVLLPKVFIKVYGFQSLIFLLNKL